MNGRGLFFNSIHFIVATWVCKHLQDAMNGYLLIKKTIR